ncbi:serine/threonine protein kinase [Catenulispora sp. GP43]|uniref:protein kinase domain-containing protein n=1 Tax=Catenulispora sp. GP43 TaxID=3156263 RepID=UPI0035137BE4
MSGSTVPGYTGTRVLGTGEAGRIDEAVHDASGDRVAVTYLSGQLCSDEVFRERFRREAELLAGLELPNVVRVRDLVESGNDMALVTDAAEGAALRRVLAISGPLSPEAALAVLRGSLLGLGAAGEIGVVHRDYQPSDVVIAPDGAVKVGGFGLAVRTEAMMPAPGTPSYMAPELWEGASPAPVSDIYAATATFYECLTGRVPYSADSVFELQTMHRAAPIPVADVPAALAPLLALGLAKTPAERPATAAAFLAELEAAAVVEYGLEWESRGRQALAASVAALPEDAMFEVPTSVLHFVSADAQDAAATAFDGVGMGRGTKIGIGAAVIAVIGAVVAAMALSPGKHSAAAAGPSGGIVSSGADRASSADGGASPGVAGADPKPGSSPVGSGSSGSATTGTGTSTSGPSTATTSKTGPGSTPATTATLVGLPVPTLNSWDPPPTSPPTEPPTTTGPGTTTGSSTPPTTPSVTVTISASASMTKSSYSGPCPPTDPPTGAVTFTVGGLPTGSSVPITYHWHVVGAAGSGSGSGELDARDGTTTTGFTVTVDQHAQQKGLSGTVEVTWSAPGTSGGTATAGSVDIVCTPGSGASSGGGATSGG